MATLSANKQLTLVELAKRTDPSGSIAGIAEVLAQDNELLVDATWIEANDTFSHKSLLRSVLPGGSWRKLNAGVTTEASETTEQIDGIGMLETYSETDRDLVLAATDPRTFRDSESKAFLEGLSQSLATAIIYGDASADPEKFTGLSPRLDGLQTGHVVVPTGPGAGSANTSIFVVQWGDDKVHMVYPKGSPNLGIKHSDLGEVTKVNSDGTMYQVMRDHFQVKAGLVVRDPRCVKRLCNIISSSTKIDDNLIKLLNAMPQRGAGAAIYCNQTVFDWLDIASKDKANVNYGEADAWGRPTMFFRGVPVRKVDAITDTEGTLT